MKETTTPTGYVPPGDNYFIVTVDEIGVGYKDDEGKISKEVEAKTP